MSSSLGPSGTAKCGGGIMDPWRKRTRRSVGVGTDLSMAHVEHLQTEITELREEVIRLEAELNRWRGGTSSTEVLKNTIPTPPRCEPELKPVPIQNKQEDELCLAVVFKTEPNPAQIHTGNSGSVAMLENLPAVYKEEGELIWMSMDVGSSSFQPKEDPDSVRRRNPSSPTTGQILSEGEVQYHSFLTSYDAEYDAHMSGRHSSQASHQENHQRKHTGKKIYSQEKLHHCTRCGKSFLTMHGLEGHHRGKPNCTVNKTYNCSLCGLSFAQQYRLARHQQIHTGEKPFPCITCGKQFAQATGLKLHQRIHTGEKPFHCTFCGKGFAQSSNLQTHMRTHTGERPFVCLICRKGFSCQSNLRRHELVHTGKKHFACFECGKDFSRESSLVSHRRIHTREKP